jgi:TPR repeat protein
MRFTNKNTLLTLAVLLCLVSASMPCEANKSLDASSPHDSEQSKEKYIDSDFEQIQKAAVQGNDQAQYNLGLFYGNDERQKALYWFQKAAEQGHVKAQIATGNYYRME